MKNYMTRMRVRDGTAFILMLAAWPSLAGEMAARLEDCAFIDADQERLACYDRLAGRREMPAGQPDGAELQQPPEGVQASAPESSKVSSILSEHWELDPAHKRGTFNFRPHRDNYLIATYNPSPNDEPYRPFRTVAPDTVNLARAELAFQLSFKLKLLENLADRPLDLWFGYTQRSFWQAGNWEASSPFRATDYQPEVMAVFPTNLNLLGLRMRFLNVGFVHHSNGQSSLLSRSWNRTYLQAGFERDNFTLLARMWKRVEEEAEEDDNPDIVDYMGRGDLVGTYRWGGHELSLLTRYNFDSDKGAVQIDWSFPLASKLNGYLQLFTGYGHTLIDYNDYQRVLGLGVRISY